MSRDEFLYRWPGGGHLLSLLELEQRMDDIIARQVQHDFAIMDSIMVEVYDTKILRSNSPSSAKMGKMSVASVIQKFG